MLPQIIKATYALVFNEGLRGGFNTMLVFKRIRLSTGREPIVFNLEPFAFQQVNSLETKRASSSAILINAS